MTTRRKGMLTAVIAAAGWGCAVWSAVVGSGDWLVAATAILSFDLVGNVVHACGRPGPAETAWLQRLAGIMGASELATLRPTGGGTDF